MTKEKMLRILAWRTLVLWFMNSINPVPEKLIVMMDAAMAFEDVPDYPLRKHAHQFAIAAERILNRHCSLPKFTKEEIWNFSEIERKVWQWKQTVDFQFRE